MNMLTRLGLLAAGVVVVLALAIGPALATEAGAEGGAPGGDDPAKIELPNSARDKVGLVLLGVSGVMVLLAGANAFQQLRGRRPQASGEWRWR